MTTPHNFAINCGASGPDGGGCSQGFSPGISVILPSVGVPQVSLSIPDFSGLTIEGLMKALEMIGLDPCAFIGPLLGGVTDFTQALEGAINNSLQGIADLPQDIVNGINNEAQQGIDDMFAGIDMSLFTDPCAGLAGAVNETMTLAKATDSDFNASITP
jgi:hypothetical protein